MKLSLILEAERALLCYEMGFLCLRRDMAKRSKFSGTEN